MVGEAMSFAEKRTYYAIYFSLSDIQTGGTLRFNWGKFKTNNGKRYFGAPVLEWEGV